MQIRKLAVAAAAVGAVGASLLVASPASADYAPGANDVVGVGSATVQYVIDFMADGAYTGQAGFNSGKPNRLVNFDATPDANARLGYGSYGIGSATAGAGSSASGTTAALNFCGPGTGGTQGTGNQNTPHVNDKPCVLNPTIILRAGTKPVQRPNGSGAGFNALKADVTLGTHVIDFSRSSSAQGDTSGTYDSINVGQDGLFMLSKTGGNAVALSAQQLKSIYQCTTTTWTAVGGGSSATIVPILPQVGSGTRKSFLALISLAEGAQGTCVQNAEENDPEAIDASGNPANAIEPMSSGRLAMYRGQDSSGTSLGFGASYFTDPSCQYGYIAAACHNGTLGGTVGTAATLGNQLAPDVQYWTTGTPSDGNALAGQVRNLYVYFRDADISTNKAMEPGTQRNWVRTLFYNPCSGTDLAGNPISIAAGNCTGGNTTGPGGAPFLANATGLVESSGVNTTSGTGTTAFGAFTRNGA